MNLPKEIESTTNNKISQAQSTIPNTNDVLLGRAANIFHHSGNRRYRHIITMNLHRYKECRNRLDKMILVKEVAEEVLDNGEVRFLRRDNSTGSKHKWKEVPFRTVQDKVSHALRDGINKTIFPTADPIKRSVSAAAPSTSGADTNSILSPTITATQPYLQALQGGRRMSEIEERIWEQQRQRTATVNTDEALLVQQQLHLLNAESNINLLNAKSTLSRQKLGSLLPFSTRSLPAHNPVPVPIANSIKASPLPCTQRKYPSLFRITTKSPSRISKAMNRHIMASTKNICVKNISRPQKTLGPSPLGPNPHDSLLSLSNKKINHSKLEIKKPTTVTTKEEFDVVHEKLVYDALQKYQEKYIANPSQTTLEDDEQ